MKIALLGDIAFFGKYSLEDGPRVRAYFARIADYLSRFDIVVGNLETPFGDAAIKPRGAKSAYIKSHPDNVQLLQLLGVNVVNLANNHLYDYGIEGCRTTIETLERHGIDWFGIDGRQVESAAGGFALHGYCSYNTNPLGVSRTSGMRINPLNVGAVEDRMRDNHRRGLLNIVSIHSGVEHIHQPSRDDILMARRLAGVCSYVYYGHHPHVVQGVEEVAGSVIAYSLGNFCFDDVYTDKSPLPLVRQTRENRTGLIVELEVEEGQILGRRFTSFHAGETEMVLDDKEGARALAEYSALLDLPESEYEAMRRSQIDRIAQAWRSRRDLRWYLKRLNWRTVDLVVRGRINRHRYRENVADFLRPAGDSARRPR